MSGYLPDGVTQADVDRHFGDGDDLCPHGSPFAERCTECRDEAAADYHCDDDPCSDDEVPF